MSHNRRHDLDLADQDLEEVAEELWNLHEAGSESLSELEERSLPSQALDAAVDLLGGADWRSVSGDRVTLTETGRALGSGRCAATGSARRSSRRCSR